MYFTLCKLGTSYLTNIPYFVYNEYHISILRMKSIIRKQIEDWPEWLLSLKELGIEYLDDHAKLLTDKSIYIYHRSWVAPLNWAILLFPKIEDTWIQKFEKMTGKTIPEFYSRFLSLINGCFIFDISLYGLSPSIFNDGLIDRKTSQALDLASANTSWINEFKIEKSFFHFGSRAYNDHENIGYFVDGKNEIFSMLKSGEVISTWPNFEAFLKDEIKSIHPKKSNPN